MIICPKCTKENQDHYKFCLGCGAELPRDASARVAKAAPAPQVSEPAPPPAAAAPAPREPAHKFVEESTSMGGADAPTDSVVCPQCSHANPPSNKFCASCGFKLGKAPTAAPNVAVSDAPPPPPPPGAIGGMPGQVHGEFTAPVPGGVSLTALRADGTEAGFFHMPASSMTIGRDTGGIFAGDSYLSPKHATITPKGKSATIRDESSLNGVYKKLTRDDPVELGLGDVFRIGQEILRVEPLTPLPKSQDGVERLGSPAKGYVGRIALVIGRDTTGNAYPIPESGLHLGRERGDVLFPEDGYVSGLHCRISYQNGKLYLTDLGSSNGSFVRLYKDTSVSTGDVLLMGQQLFRVAIN